jgi:phosphatidylinositol glycan class M
MWYLCFLPLVLPNTTLINKNKQVGLFLLAAWIGGQLIWLYFAFQLEHMGQNTFFQLWTSSIIFYLSQLAVIAAFMKYKL